MKILEIEIFGRGGLTHYVYNLSRELGARGHETVIATAGDYELDAHVRDLPPGVRVERVFSRLAGRMRGRLPYRVVRAFKGFEFVGDAFSVTALVRRFQPDVIHVHCTNAIILWLMQLLKPHRRPIVYTAHDVTPHERFKLERPIYRRIYALADHIIAHSQVDRERLAAEFGLDEVRVSVVPHGNYAFFLPGENALDRAGARRELGLGADDEVALFFGFIREYKGLDVLLEAWPDLSSARPRARLVVAGDPARMEAPRARELEARAAALGAVHHFRYIPFDAVGTYFAAADVLVLPYRTISQSGVLLLALSLGVPVIATRVGAFPEVIRDGENGMLVDPGSVPQLRSALLRILGDPDLRRRLAEAGKRTAKRDYSWGAIAGRTEQVFTDLVGGRVGKAAATV